MRAIFGLGNPGKKFEKTRHNIGYIIVNHLSDYYDVPFKAGKGDYYYTEFAHHGERILLVKPTTYMNRSGVAVRHVLNYFPVSEQDILIVYDDFNLPYGTIRFRSQGSDGGHNGIRSIIESLGSNEFQRIRIGIGSPEDKRPLEKYVLGNFSQKERETIDETIEYAVKAAKLVIRNKITQAMNEYN